jgi:2-dehydro-3-deoxyphosphogalactonate aldolase
MRPDLPSIVAILRGVTPDRVVDVTHVLLAQGIRAIEVPLNSPNPFESISRLAKAIGKDCLCGAGTVLYADDVSRAADAGGRLIVTPNTDVSVIERARAKDLMVMPGFGTATEAFAAIRAGARQLKLFPAATYGPDHLFVLRSVLPTDIAVFAVGGVTAENVAPWLDAGATGFGFGSELFKPQYSDKEIETRARRLIEAVGTSKRTD